jgi:WD40 repeat protein
MLTITTLVFCAAVQAEVQAGKSKIVQTSLVGDELFVLRTDATLSVYKREGKKARLVESGKIPVGGEFQYCRLKEGLAIWDKQGNLLKYDFSSRKTSKLLKGEPGDEIKRLTISDNLKYAAIQDSTGDIEIMDLSNRSTVVLFEQTESKSYPLGWSLEGKYFFMGNKDGDVTYYVIKDRRVQVPLETVSGDGFPIESLRVSGDGKMVVTMDSKNHIRVSNLESKRQVLSVLDSKKKAKAVLFSSDSKHLITPLEDGQVAVFDLSTKKRRTLDGVANAITFDTAGPWLICSSEFDISIVHIGGDEKSFKIALAESK